eukprot:11659873-Alexandrium_andersonii.AAC.1
MASEPSMISRESSTDRGIAPPTVMSLLTSGTWASGLLVRKRWVENLCRRDSTRRRSRVDQCRWRLKWSRQRFRRLSLG